MEIPKRIPRNLLNQLAEYNIVPSDLVFYVNSECNLRCKHCYIGNSLLSKAVSYDLNNSVDFINSFTCIDRLILLGGEPLLYDSFDKLVNSLDLNKINDLRITSNLTDIDVVASFSADVKRKVRMSISLDGHNAKVHDQIRGKGSFDKSVQNLHQIINDGIDVEITHTLMRNNINDFDEFITFCKSLGVTKVNLHRMSLHGNAIQNMDLQVSATEYVLFRERLMQKSNPYGTLNIRYPLLFADEDLYTDLVNSGKYHPHAQKSFYGDGVRIIIYPTREIYISSELFGTESYLGRFDDDRFYFNYSNKNELSSYMNDPKNHSISVLNPNQHGDENYPFVLSVSFKESILI